MLKADFHIHTDKDPNEMGLVNFNSFEIIDKAKQKGFDVLAITHHDHIFSEKGAFAYAKKRGILLIKGCEATVEGKHVVILNPSKVPKTFYELRRMRSKEDIIVIAPHPFFILPNCLGRKLEEHIDLFDCIEYSFFYTPFFNLNKKALEFAKKYKKPVVGNSDLHKIQFFGRAYSLVDSKKTVKSVLNALRKGKVRAKVIHMSLFKFIKTAFLIIFSFRIRGQITHNPRNIYK